MAKRTLVSKVETYVIVTLVTVLVWLYAEAKNSKTDSTTIKIQCVAPPDQKMIVTPSEVQFVDMKFQCAASRLEQVKAIAKVFEIIVGQTITEQTQQQEVDLLESMGERKEFDNLGVTVLSATLAETGEDNLTVTIEPFVEVKLPIVVTAPGSVLAGSPDWEPKEATVSMRAGLAAVVRQRKLYLSGLLTQKFLADFPVNIEQTEVPLQLNEHPLLQDESLDGLPHIVKVSFTKRSQTKEHILEVPIKILAPLGALGDYRVEPKGDLFRFVPVRLSGPHDVIDDIRQGKREVVAYLPLSAAELGEGISSKSVVFWVPAGVTVLEPAPGTLVELEITRRSEADASTAVERIEPSS